MRLLDLLLVCLFVPDQARRNVGLSAGSKLFVNLAGGKRREQTNLLFDFLESLSTILGQSINLDTTASDEDPMYTLTEIIQVKHDTVCMPGSRKFCQSESNFYTLFLFNEGRDDPNTTISWPSSAPDEKRHLSDVSLECRYWPYIQCSFVIF